METRLVTPAILEQCEKDDAERQRAGREQIFHCYLSPIAQQIPLKPVRLKLRNILTGEERLAWEIYDEDEIEAYISRQLFHDKYERDKALDPMIRGFEEIIEIVPAAEIEKYIIGLVSEFPKLTLSQNQDESEQRKNERSKKINESIVRVLLRYEAMKSKAAVGKKACENFAEYLASTFINERLKINIRKRQSHLLAANDENVLRQRMPALFDGFDINRYRNHFVYPALDELVNRFAELSTKDVETKSQDYQLYMRIILGFAADDLFDKECNFRKEIVDVFNENSFFDELGKVERFDLKVIKVAFLFAYWSFIFSEITAHWHDEKREIPTNFTSNYHDFFKANYLAVLQSPRCKAEYLNEAIKDFIKICSMEAMDGYAFGPGKNKEDKREQIKSAAYMQIAQFFPYQKETMKALFEGCFNGHEVEAFTSEEEEEQGIAEMTKGDPEQIHVELKRPDFFTRHKSAFLGTGMGTSAGALGGSMIGVLVGIAIAVLTGGWGALAIPICMGLGAVWGGSGGGMMGGTCGYLDDEERNRSVSLMPQEEPESESEEESSCTWKCTWSGVLTCLGIKKNPYQLLNDDEVLTPYVPMDDVGGDEERLTTPRGPRIDSLGSPEFDVEKDMGDTLGRDDDRDPFPSPRNGGV